MIHVRDISIRRVYLVLYLFIFSCYYSDNNFKSKVGVSKVFVLFFFFTQIQETQIQAHLKLIIPAWHVRPSRIWSRPNSSHLHSLMQPNWSHPCPPVGARKVPVFSLVSWRGIIADYHSQWSWKWSEYGYQGRVCFCRRKTYQPLEAPWSSGSPSPRTQ